MPKIYNLVGRIFGRLEVKSLSEKKMLGRTDRFWNCDCSCGQQSAVTTSLLISGSIKSCGCLLRDGSSRITHGLSLTRAYHIYKGMIRRC